MQIKGKPGASTKVVLEVRYRDGWAYLDKCGRTINKIIQDNPEWFPKGADPTNAGLVSMQNRCSFNFSSLQYSFNLERPLGGDALQQADFDTFCEQVATVSNIVHDYLGLKAFTRVGCRIWYFFEADSKENAEKWLLDLGICQVSPHLERVFESKISSASTVVVMAGADRMYRISMNSVERSAQLDLGSEILTVRASSLSKEQNKFLLKQLDAKKRMLASPGFAAMIDVDAYQEEPVTIDARDFVATTIKLVAQKLPQAIAG
jgi:hypothetical protein